MRSGNSPQRTPEGKRDRASDGRRLNAADQAMKNIGVLLDAAAGVANRGRSDEADRQ